MFDDNISFHPFIYPSIPPTKLDLILFGQTRSLTTNSMVKKMTTMLSIISMINTTVGY